MNAAIPHSGHISDQIDHNPYLEELQRWKQWYRDVAGFIPFVHPYTGNKAKWPVLATMTGTRPGYFVVDIDNYDVIPEMAKQGKTFPATVTAQSGGGGMHLYYRHPMRYKIGNQEKFWPGIDLLADNRLVILPPSISGKGGRYRWVSEQVGKDYMAEPPRWLLKEAYERGMVKPLNKKQ